MKKIIDGMYPKKVYLFNQKADKLIFLISLIVLILLASTLKVYYEEHSEIEKDPKVETALLDNKKTSLL